MRANRVSSVPAVAQSQIFVRRCSFHPTLSNTTDADRLKQHVGEEPWSEKPKKAPVGIMSCCRGSMAISGGDDEASCDESQEEESAGHLLSYQRRGPQRGAQMRRFALVLRVVVAYARSV
eukprot:229490-Rhodomonas_salina.3